MGNNTPIPPKHKFTTCICANPSCSHPTNSISRNECKNCGSLTILDERYRMLKTLGRGGFGNTYLAIDEHLPFQPFCVVKILHNSLGSMHFEREALALFNLGSSHPQIPSLLAALPYNKTKAIVQEYIAGHTLTELIQECGSFSETQVREFLKSIVPVLSFVHRHGAVHRDIKPDNIIQSTSTDQRYHLVDFGATNNMENRQKQQQQQRNSNNSINNNSHQNNTNNTNNNITNHNNNFIRNQNQNHNDTLPFKTRIGTIGYGAPEAIGGRGACFASDIYSLGVTCLFLLTGMDPSDILIHFDSFYDCIVNMRDQEHISKSLARVLKRMTADDLPSRYSDTKRIFEDLESPFYDLFGVSFLLIIGVGAAIIVAVIGLYISMAWGINPRHDF